MIDIKKAKYIFTLKHQENKNEYIQALSLYTLTKYESLHSCPPRPMKFNQESK